MRFFLQNFGCKVNRYDAELIAQRLIRDGHQRVSDPSEADVRLVNTCAVTRRAEAKAVRFIRRVAREGEGREIVAMGCAVERDPATFRNCRGVGLSLGTREKYGVAGFFHGRGSRGTSSTLRGSVAREGVPVDHEGIESFEGRRRAFLKIQDGCDYRCSYCIIPVVRGRSVSRPPAAIVGEARSLVAGGFREIVLTGIHIGLYGRDLSPPGSLEELIDTLLEQTAGVRYRLSSIDAHELREGLVERIAGADRICNHLHVPLQSGSPSILRAMRRRTSVREYMDRCSRIAERIPSLGLGTDVIVGFPGESESDFRRSCRVVESLPFSYVHVFPYSPRPGTAAYGMRSDWVDGAVVRERTRRLREIARRSGEAFRRRQIGRTEEIVVERRRGTWFVGRCSNYLRAYFPSSAGRVGGCVRGRIEGIHRDGVRVSVGAAQ